MIKYVDLFAFFSAEVQVSSNGPSQASSFVQSQEEGSLEGWTLELQTMAAHRLGAALDPWCTHGGHGVPAVL